MSNNIETKKFYSNRLQEEIELQILPPSSFEKNYDIPYRFFHNELEKIFINKLNNVENKVSISYKVINDLCDINAHIVTLQCTLLYKNEKIVFWSEVNNKNIGNDFNKSNPIDTAKRRGFDYLVLNFLDFNFDEIDLQNIDKPNTTTTSIFSNNLNQNIELETIIPTEEEIINNVVTRVSTKNLLFILNKLFLSNYTINISCEDMSNLINLTKNIICIKLELINKKDNTTMFENIVEINPLNISGLNNMAYPIDFCIKKGVGRFVLDLLNLETNNKIYTDYEIPSPNNVIQIGRRVFREFVEKIAKEWEIVDLNELYNGKPLGLWIEHPEYFVLTDKVTQNENYHGKKLGNIATNNPSYIEYMLSNSTRVNATPFYKAIFKAYQHLYHNK